MSSIFHLKQSVKELESSNNDITKQSYIQIPASKDVSGDNFSNGSQFYDIDTSGNRWWLPSRSYFRVRCKLTRPDGTPLRMEDNVAPAYNMASTLWQSQEARIGGVAVSSTNEFVAQVDTIQNRTEKSRAWTKSVGLSSNFLEQDFSIRQAEVCADGSLINGTLAKERQYETFTELKIPATATLERGAAGFIIADTAEFTDGIDIKWVSTQIRDPSTQTFHQVVSITAGADKKSFTIVTEPAPPIQTAAAVQNYDLWVKYKALQVLLPPSRQVSEFELIYQPSLGLFNYEGALPCNTRIVMNPLSKNQIKLSAVETQLIPKDFKLSIEDVYLYACVVDGRRCDDTSFYLDLQDTRLQMNKISNNQFTQRTFDIRPSVKAITICFQDARAGADNKVTPTKFKLYNTTVNANSTQFDVGLTLNRMYFQYAGNNYPAQTDTDPSYDVTLNKDLTTRMYTDSLIQTGSWFDTGGSESIQEFHQAGQYFHQKIYKDATDRSTRLTLYTAFASDVNADNSRALVFDTASKVCKIEMANGQVKSVEVTDE